MARFEEHNEYKFVEQVHFHAYDQTAYWIGGTSSRGPGDCTIGTNLPDNGKCYLIPFTYTQY